MLEHRLCPSWTDPVNLGPPINTEYYDGYTASLTHNGLSLYFTSNRPGSIGSQDIWVSQRAHVNDPWNPPQDLGPTINGNFQTHSQNLTADGHWMYFTSNRPGGLGGMDIWRSYRADTQNDFAWQEPENLGPNVNSSMGEACPFPFEDPQTGLITLYFASNRTGGQGWDIYASAQQQDGSFAPAMPVPELNSSADEKHFSVRPDGLMGILASDREGTLGDLDLWVTTRASTHDPWSTPVNMGPTINSAARDAMPAWAPDGRTLFFESAREGGYGVMDLYETTWQPSTWTVTNAADSGAGSLRAVMAAAFSGDQIVFDQSLHGQTITLTSGELAIAKSLDIEGLGADQLAVSGNHASRIFDISGGVTVTIAGLTITDGMAFQMGAAGQGGAIRNVGSNLTVANDVLSNNETRGLGAQGQGGAIANSSGATLTVMNSQFIHNQAHGVASGPPAGAAGQGGAINSVGTLTVAHSLFLQNQAIGDNAANGGAINCMGSASVSDSSFTGNQSIGGSGAGGSGFSRGGAIYNSSGTLTVENSTFTANQAIAGSGNSGGNLTGQAIGGGIANTEQGILFMTGTTLAGNQARGGFNNTGTGGLIGSATGGGLISVGAATISDTTFEDNEARGGSGNTGGGTSFSLVGIAIGGAIATGADNSSGGPNVLIASNLTLHHNRAVGGTGNTAGTFAGTGMGGGLMAYGGRAGGPPGGSTTTVSDSTIADNEALGGQGAEGGDGGDARGGGVANLFGANVTVSGSTLTGNQALGGAGGSGGNGGNGFGGAIFNDGPSTFPTNLGAPTILSVQGSTLTDNEAEGGATGAGGSNAGQGAGGGISSAGILAVLGSSLAHNLALGRDGLGGADGGDGLGGGLYIASGTASILATAIDHNRAFGGDGDAGSNGGNGLGGGVDVAAGTVIVVASDISYNQAHGGLGDGGGTDGLGIGGGVYNLGTFLFDPSTVIANNHASTSNDDCFGC